jgi:aminoglycoside 3-N-acetyltransferase
MTGFTAKALTETYRALGVERGRVVYVTGNLGRLGFVDGEATGNERKSATLHSHLNAIIELIGDTGTIAFPTHSWGLVNSQAPFNKDTTAADYMFSEFIRTKMKCRRTLHPFASIAAFGAQAREIVPDGLVRHPYGYGSAFERLVEADALHVSIGLEARKTISAVHHCEQLATVPYRYNKEFPHPVDDGDDVKTHDFFLYVTYLSEGLIRDRNTKIFEIPENAGSLKRSDIGRAMIESINLKTFVATTARAMKEDPYIWLKHAPASRPWRS